MTRSETKAALQRLVRRTTTKSMLRWSPFVGSGEPGCALQQVLGTRQWRTQILADAAGITLEEARMIAEFSDSCDLEGLRWAVETL